MIDRFAGKYRFLSNFHPSALWHDGILYPTVEHAYQAAKTDDREWRLRISKCATPGQAKRLGRSAPLRDGWYLDRYRVMSALVEKKFIGYRHLADLLVATGNEQIVEGNTWGDTYWGVCNGVGENALGRILMSLRERLQRARR